MIIASLLTYNMLECHHYPGLIYINSMMSSIHTRACKCSTTTKCSCLYKLATPPPVTFWPSKLSDPWKPSDLQNFLTFKTFRPLKTFWPSKPSDLQNLMTFKTFWPSKPSDLQNFLTLKTFWHSKLSDLHMCRYFESMLSWVNNKLWHHYVCTPDIHQSKYAQATALYILAITTQICTCHGTIYLLPYTITSYMKKVVWQLTQISMSIHWKWTDYLNESMKDWHSDTLFHVMLLEATVIIDQLVLVQPTCYIYLPWYSS